MLSKQTRKTSPNSMRKRAREEKANGSENTGWKQSKKFEKRVGINQLKAYVILFLFVSTHPVCSECVNVQSSVFCICVFFLCACVCMRVCACLFVCWFLCVCVCVRAPSYSLSVSSLIRIACSNTAAAVTHQACFSCFSGPQWQICPPPFHQALDYEHTRARTRTHTHTHARTTVHKLVKDQ